MAQRNVRRWIIDKVNLSTTVAPSTYPRDVCAGILYSYGFDSSKIQVYPNRIVTELDIDTEAAIMINIPTSTQVQKTGQGAYAILVVNHKIELDVLFYANIYGEFDSDGNQVAPPTYANQQVSDIMFDKLLKGIEKTISLSVYKYDAPNVIGSGGSQPMFDTTSDNELTVINAIQPLITISNEGASRLEDSNNLIYQATVFFEVIETYQTVVN